MALDFAKEKHAGQIRRDGSDYFGHIERVHKNFKMIAGDNAWGYYEILAALHDILEDKRATEDEIIDFLKSTKDVYIMSNGQYIISDLKRFLTKDDGADYFDYIKNIKENACHEIQMVKLSDILDNISDAGCTDKQRAKYRKALEILKN